MSYTRHTTSQARSASDRKSKSGITSWSWCAEKGRGEEDAHHVGPKLVFYSVAAVGPYQQVLLLTINVRRVDSV